MTVVVSGSLVAWAPEPPLPRAEAQRVRAEDLGGGVELEEEVREAAAPIVWLRELGGGVLGGSGCLVVLVVCWGGGISLRRV